MQDSNNKQNLITLRLYIEPACIQVVQNLVSTVASQHKMPEKDIFSLTLAVEEAILNILNYGLTPYSDRTIQVDIEVDSFDFNVSIKDWGVPFDFEKLQYSPNNLDGIGIYMMNHLADRVYMSIGEFGRIQKLVKHLTVCEVFTKAEEMNESVKAAEQLPEGLVFTLEHTKMEDSIMVAQCMYDEFGYSYPYPRVYCPEKFMEAIKVGDVYSLVSRASNGEAAGHLALVFNSDQQGMAEMGMGVVKMKYRKCSVLNALTSEIIKTAREKYSLNAMIARPVLHHTITQHMCNKTNMIPCMFSLCCYQFDTKINNSYDRRGVSCGILPFNDFGNGETIHIPKKVLPIADWIYPKIGLQKKYDIRNGGFSKKASYRHSVNLSQRHADIYVDSMDSQWEYRLKSLLQSFKVRHVESAEMFINMSNRSAIAVYNVAVKYGFFCTGILPMCTNGDYLVLNSMLNCVINYDKIQTIEPFTSLLALVRAQDPNENIKINK